MGRWVGKNRKTELLNVQHQEGYNHRNRKVLMEYAQPRLPYYNNNCRVLVPDKLLVAVPLYQPVHSLYSRDNNSRIINMTAGRMHYNDASCMNEHAHAKIA